MRAVGAARWFLASTSIVALAAIFAPERAYATCYYDMSDLGVIAHSGDNCPAAGHYNGAPPAGYVAFTADSGGVITSTGAVTINTPATPPSAYGVYANGGQINLTAGISDVGTSGATAYDFYASNGGVITFAEGKIKSIGADAFGLYASGPGSTITVTGALTTIQTSEASADGVVADSGGAVSLMNGGQIRTSGTGGTGLAAMGVDSETGDRSTITATGVAVTTGFVTNNSAVGVLASAGGTVSLTGGSVMTSGGNAQGLWATGSGSSITALNGTTIATTGAGSPGVQADMGGAVSLSGGSVMTSGAGAYSLYVTGGSSIMYERRYRDGSQPWSGNQRRRRPGLGWRNGDVERRVGHDLRRQCSRPLGDRLRFERHRIERDDGRDHGGREPGRPGGYRWRGLAQRRLGYDVRDQRHGPLRDRRQLHSDGCGRRHNDRLEHEQ